MYRCILNEHVMLHVYDLEKKNMTNIFVEIGTLEGVTDIHEEITNHRDVEHVECTVLMQIWAVFIVQILTNNKKFCGKLQFL